MAVLTDHVCGCLLILLARLNPKLVSLEVTSPSIRVLEAHIIQRAASQPRRGSRGVNDFVNLFRRAFICVFERVIPIYPFELVVELIGVPSPLGQYRVGVMR